MYHLRLIKGLSYDGAVRASAGAPDVFTDDPDKYTAAMKSGYFEAVSVPQQAVEKSENSSNEMLTGHLDPAQLSDMDEEELKKLASDMGLNTDGLDKDGLIAAITAEKVLAPAHDAEPVDLSKLKVDELKAYAEERGVVLTGCSTKAAILQKISEFEADAAAASAILRGAE